MFDIFNPVRALFKFDYVSIDNKIFFLHTKVTSVLFVAFCVIVSTRQFIMHAIDCDLGSISYYTTNSYCLNRGTYVISRLFDGYDWPTIDPGVGPQLPGDKRIYLNYYQWVGLSLIIQATIFYVPQLIWKKVEGGQLKKLVKAYEKPTTVGELQLVREATVDYLVNSWSHRKSYLIKLVQCEVLNSFIVLAQFHFMDYFLNGEFVCYGINYMLYLLFDVPEYHNPMHYIFPRRSKCEYRNFGPSGYIEVRDILCTLNVNIVNQKIYLFIWFWFNFLLIANFFMIVFQFLTIGSRRVRTYLLHSVCKWSKSNEIETIGCSLHFSDWFLFYQFAKNVKAPLMKHIVSDIAKILEEKNDAVEQLDVPFEN